MLRRDTKAAATSSRVYLAGVLDRGVLCLDRDTGDERNVLVSRYADLSDVVAIWMMARGELFVWPRLASRVFRFASDGSELEPVELPAPLRELVPDRVVATGTGRIAILGTSGRWPERARLLLWEPATHEVIEVFGAAEDSDVNPDTVLAGGWLAADPAGGFLYTGLSPYRIANFDGHGVLHWQVTEPAPFERQSSVAAGQVDERSPGPFSFGKSGWPIGGHRYLLDIREPTAHFTAWHDAGRPDHVYPRRRLFDSHHAVLWVSANGTATRMAKLPGLNDLELLAALGPGTFVARLGVQTIVEATITVTVRE
ncbi:MAG: hypothetical protein GKS06_15775 [Acidobacteria bacterium]|nr:hypothetical protein [Acidobacteriota bacterium]